MGAARGHRHCLQPGSGLGTWSPGQSQLATNWPCPESLGPAVIALATCCGSTMRHFFLKKAKYAGKIFLHKTLLAGQLLTSPPSSTSRGFPLWQTPLLQEEDSPAGSFFPGKWLNCHPVRFQPLRRGRQRPLHGSVAPRSAQLCNICLPVRALRARCDSTSRTARQAWWWDTASQRSPAPTQGSQAGNYIPAPGEGGWPCRGA